VAYRLLLGLCVLVLVVRSPLAGALEFPQTFPESLGNLWQLLPTKEEQGDQQNEQ